MLVAEDGALREVEVGLAVGVARLLLVLAAQEDLQRVTRDGAVAKLKKRY